MSAAYWPKDNRSHAQILLNALSRFRTKEGKSIEVDWQVDFLATALAHLSNNQVTIREAKYAITWIENNEATLEACETAIEKRRAKKHNLTKSRYVCYLPIGVLFEKPQLASYKI